MQRNILPWVLLGTAVVVAVAVLRSPAAPVEPPSASTAPSGPPVGPSGVPAGPGPVPSARTYNDPPLDDTEMRESHIHIAHEFCEESAKHINELEGLNPTDPKGIRIIGSCLQHGNLAWYKCVAKAGTRLEAGTCNRRLLNNVGPQ